MPIAVVGMLICGRPYLVSVHSIQEYSRVHINLDLVELKHIGMPVIP